ncbi:MAG: hypothetical protein ABFR05_02295 [Bacteroidota bacterium]
MINKIKRSIQELSKISWNYDYDVINSLTANDLDADTEPLLLQYQNELDLAKSLWSSFLNKTTKEEISDYLMSLSNLPVNTIEESRLMLILQTVLATKKGDLDTISQDLVIRGVMGLLRSGLTRQKVYYFSDTIKGGDIAKSKIRDHYEIMNERFGVYIQVVDYIGSVPGRSLQTGSQVLDLLGNRAELELDYHENTIFRSSNIFINNASRAKYAGKERSQGSDCLWARVRDPKTNVLHNVIGVDNEAYTPLKDYIEELYIIKGIPGHSKLEDLSIGTQFRSLKHFIIPQALCTITNGGCPPGFAVTKLEVSEHIPSLDIEPNEVVITNPDHYYNGKSLSSHKEGIFGIAKHLGVDLDTEVIAEFYNPDTNELIDKRNLILTAHLGKHGGKDTITNGSSRGLDGYILPEIGRSWDKSSFNDYAFYIKEMPIGTRVKLFKK